MANVSQVKFPFSDIVCNQWATQTNNLQQTCCIDPKIVNFLKQDRAIDEPPSLYQKCVNCNRVQSKTK